MDRSNLSRKEALGKLIVLPALAAAVVATPEIASAKMTQKAAKYVNKPHGSQACGNCRFFQAGKTKTASGQCQIVAGFVSPHGWCSLYAAKS
jgi:hypothetical protein